MTAYGTLQMDTETCNCKERGVSFGSCDPGQADWRRHDDPDIGLTGDCLPDVPEKYVNLNKLRITMALRYVLIFSVTAP